MSHHYDLLSIYESKARIDSEIKRYDHQIQYTDHAVINFNKLTIFYQLYFLGDVKSRMMMLNSCAHPSRYRSREEDAERENSCCHAL